MQGLKDKLAAKVAEVFGAGARVRGWEALAGDASSRRYFRVSLDARGAPCSVIVMSWNDSGLPVSSEELALFDKPPEELPFLNVHRFLQGIGVRVPAIYGQWVEQGLMLLEDLGDASLWDRVREAPEVEVLQWYQRAIDELLVLQIGGTRARNDQCMAFRQAFDQRLYLWEFDHFIEYGLEAGDKGSLPASERRLLDEAFGGIAGHLSAQPRVLNHRDFHSWNLMTLDDAVAVIDFQDALLAPAQYDLASLLNDRETDQVVTPAVEEQLIDYYLERWQEWGESARGRDEFVESYLLSALQRDFKVVGRFRYLDLVKGKPGYKQYIAPTLRRIGRNLRRAPGVEQLLPVLAAHFEEIS
ncbi:MAG: phosphotransferase [Deltaproteobacteria bacterium]|nr:phosphotransferase [Deltaproteobacteria bacterium]